MHVPETRRAGAVRDGQEIAGVSESLWTFGSGDRPSAKARRAGDTVVRSAAPWSPTVVTLLRHLERNGFTGAPTVVALDDETETLTYLPGTSPHPRAWTDEAAHRLGEVLRAAHDAAADFAVADARWQPWFGRELPGDSPVIGHCDTGPWNWVAGDDGLPYALIDWEFAGPVDARWELAAATWLNAQLHDDDIAEMHGLPDATDRARQAGLILDGYGLAFGQRAGMLDRMIEFAIHDARAEATTHGVAASTPTGSNPKGYPLLWAIAWRARSASWMLRHRTLLERAIAR